MGAHCPTIYATMFTAVTTLLVQPTIAMDPFGTFVTPDGNVIELQKSIGNAISGRLVTIDDTGSISGNDIIIRGSNSAKGQLLLDFTSNGMVVGSGTYSRSTSTLDTPSGALSFTNWTSSDISASGLVKLNNLQSIISGTTNSKSVNIDNYGWNKYFSSIPLSPALALNDFIENELQISDYAAGTEQYIDNGYVALKTSRAGSAYAQAIAAKSNFGMDDLVFQTLGSDTDTVAFVRADKFSDFADKIEALQASINSDAHKNTQLVSYEVIPAGKEIPFDMALFGTVVQIPAPNFVSSYLSHKFLDDSSSETVKRIFKRMATTECNVGLPRLNQIMIRCDYFHDAFSASSDSIWYMTAICVSINPSMIENMTVVSLFPKTLVSNRTKNEYDLAKKEWKQPKITVSDAENFVLQAFINSVANEYPGTHQ